MAIKSSFNTSLVKDYLSACRELADNYVYQAFAYLGEQCVNKVRDRSAEESWIDQTGNLRSSIGYIITRNGKVVAKSGFKPTNAPEGKGGEGQQKGENYANTIASQYSSSPLAMIIVAGMEYAIYVEARNNKDVLAATELWARAEWESRIPTLKAKIEEGWKKLAHQMNIE